MHIKFTPKDICLIAVLAAIVFVMTVVPRVPIPLGYAHLGDAAIMLAAYYGERKTEPWLRRWDPLCLTLSEDIRYGLFRH